jgi:leucine-rich repeat protein SHOC2
MEWNLQALQCLSHFSFGEYEDIESFPEKTLLPTTLIIVGIWDLQNLKSLDYEGLQHLTSLTQMRISHCPNLQSMPGGAAIFSFFFNNLSMPFTGTKVSA